MYLALDKNRRRTAPGQPTVQRWSVAVNKVVLTEGVLGHRFLPLRRPGLVVVSSSVVVVIWSPTQHAAVLYI